MNTDVTVLADVFENIIDTALEEVRINLSFLFHYHFLPGVVGWE